MKVKLFLWGYVGFIFCEELPIPSHRFLDSLLILVLILFQSTFKDFRNLSMGFFMFIMILDQFHKFLFNSMIGLFRDTIYLRNMRGIKIMKNVLNYFFVQDLIEKLFWPHSLGSWMNGIVIAVE